ncbi:unnamed protein product [Arctia plantaginis]|uniref:Tudor domain-containing protein 5 n=1 Tax=Arctia plantaginis TaxID=874455 RepID=A0A8S1BHE8_ARCPL|nr:unnamed protein product [Arctia plantaginis]CAB3257980.1 unnamed protein product [Arctia plantaginis]
MEEEIGQLKSVLRSLVVSSPTQVDVRSLLRDYRNMIGSTVPLRKYGYNNPVDFFKERFSDCFLFSGPTSNPVLTLIVPETLKHIDKFVQKQKSSSTSKFNPKRRSVPEELVNTSQNKPLSKTKNKKHILSQPIELSKESHEKSSSQQICPVKSHISVSKPSIPPTPTEDHVSACKPSIPASKSFASGSKLNIQCSKHNGTKSFKSVNNVPHTDQTKHNGDTNTVNSQEVLEDKDKTDSKTEDIPINSTDAVKKFLKKRLPLYQSEQYLHEESAEQCSKTLHDDTSGQYTSSSGSSAKAQQLERLKQELMVLITDAPDGVWCTDLLKLYKERYDRELNFSRFGYTSILSLVYSLERHVLITRPDDTGDWLLQERRRATPAPGALRVRRRTAPAPRADHSDDALPGIDFDPDVFPEDCMHFMESIESTSVSDFRPGAMVEVMIGEVYSPSHFWFLRLGENYNMAMEDMMDEMTQYYRNEGRNRVLARGAVRLGHYCASVYEGDWHRSLIVKIIDSDTVKVRHIDYGTVDTLAVSELKPLKRSWAALPAQACRARLAAVRPSAAGWRWPHAAATAFLALVTDRRLVANVVAVDGRDNVAEVLLIDTASDEDVCIGTELIRAGHADARHDSALHVSSSPPSTSSDVSASASELQGRGPRRLRTWDAAPLVTSSLLRRRLELYKKYREPANCRN